MPWLHFSPKRALPLLTVLLVQLCACLVARQLGPLAISDDDYARVVIAQALAEQPRLDPTGTSWLPFPFYVTGAALLLLGSSLEVARAVQLLFALVSSALLFFGARRLGLAPWRAALSTGLAACLPTAALLAAATVPEYPTSACLAFALFCLTAEGTRRATAAGRVGGVEQAAAAPTQPKNLPAQWALHLWPLLGALACFLACASRYEAWPIAGVYAGVTLRRALRFEVRSARRWTLGVAALAAAFPLLWLLHGAYWHGDPFFFVARVARYKAALGGAAPDAAAAWLGYPVAALRQEPGVTALLGAALILGTASRGGRAALRALGPVLLAMAVLLVVLVCGDVRGGAPTHHPERALLSLWLLAPALGLQLLGARFPRVPGAQRWGLGAALVAVGLLLTVRFRPTPGAFADRAEEERMGRLLQERSGQVVVLTQDYGYLAVQAASGHPSRFIVVDKNDPRQPHSTLSADERARAVMARTRAPWAVLPLGIVVPGYRMIEHGTRLALLEADAGESRYAWNQP